MNRHEPNIDLYLKRGMEIFLENSTDGFIALNQEWEFIYLNIQAERYLAKSRDVLLGINIWDAFPSLLNTPFYINYHRAMQEQIPVRFEEFFIPLDAWFEVRVFPFEGGLTIYFRDITESKRTIQELKDSNERLKESEKKFRQLFEDANDAIFLHGYQDNEMPDKFLEVNDTACKIFGYSKEEFLKISPVELEGQESNEELEQTSKNVVKSGNKTFERILMSKNGEKIPFELNTHIFELDSKIMALSVARDISERKKAEDLIRYMAYHDSLTDLPNRRLFNESLKNALVDAGNQGKKVGVVFLDLDKFKNINDKLGHDVGDRLLQQVAHRLRITMENNTLVARMGGDEFILLVPDLDNENSITKLLNKIDVVFSRPWTIENHRLEITTSAGIAIFPKDGEDTVALLKNADIAMYQAKEIGGNNSKRYTRKDLNKTTI